MKQNKGWCCLLLCITILLSGCNSLSIRDKKDISAVVENPESAKQVIKNKGQSYVESQIPADLKALKATVEKFLRQIDKIWGKDDAKQPGPKDYVK